MNMNIVTLQKKSFNMKCKSSLNDFKNKKNSQVKLELMKFLKLLNEKKEKSGYSHKQSEHYGMDMLV